MARRLRHHGAMTGRRWCSESSCEAACSAMASEMFGMGWRQIGGGHDCAELSDWRKAEGVS